MIVVLFVLAPPKHHYYDRNYYDSNLICFDRSKHHYYDRNYYDSN